MNLADPELELIDPTPNIHSLFVHFDELFFYSKLNGRALVRWSRRMYSCAGICSYEGRNGICDIALSEPLLKLRTRKDLIETLLHEMIHALLFITNRDMDRDGHGHIFQAHMHRINKKTGLNISVYHDFHEEVALYLRHWWRCNGMCQKAKPHFGVVRRSSNRAPGPHEVWWESHKNKCGGTFIKIKTPQPSQKPKKNVIGKSNATITKHIIKKIISTVHKNVTTQKKIANVTNTIPNNKITTILPPANAANIMKIIESTRRNAVIDKVREVWVKKQIAAVGNVKAPDRSIWSMNPLTAIKHKADSVHTDSPPTKINKIDNYFTSTASTILKDVYGKEFIVTQSNNNKLKAVTVEEGNGSTVMEQGTVTEDLVNCPSCNAKVSHKDINRHLDECLNKAIIETLTEENVQTPSTTTTSQTNEDKRKLKDIVGDIPKTPTFKPNTENKTDLNIPIKEKDNTNDVKSSEPSTSTENYEDQMCPVCEKKVEIPIELHLDDCLEFFKNNDTIPEEGSSMKETITIEDEDVRSNVKVEPGTSKKRNTFQKCPCCGDTVTKPMEIHLDECLGLFNNDATQPIEGASPVAVITIDEEDESDDEFDETQTLNATGTKTPCPCCLKMVEIELMNDHLDVCML